MTNYSKAYKAGIEAAKASQKSKNEIEEIFKDINTQLQALSNGKIGIVKRLFTKKTHSWDMSSVNPFKIPETFWGVVAFNPKNPEEDSFRISEWQQDPSSGYPCKILWSFKEISCDDKESLELGLEELLSSPETGEIFQKLSSI